MALLMVFTALVQPGFDFADLFTPHLTRAAMRSPLRVEVATCPARTLYITYSLKTSRIIARLQRDHCYTYASERRTQPSLLRSK